MSLTKHSDNIVSAALSFIIVLTFILWTELDYDLLHSMIREDRPIEILTAVFYGLSSICFIIIAIRSDFLKEQNSRAIYFFTICWALLMFFFMGEEISWGQRIFNIETPAALKKVNVQHETNIHNLGFFYKLGGIYRGLSIMMLTTGLLLPLFAASNYGKRIIQRFAFPVAPLGYSILFVGAYVYGRFYTYIYPYSNDSSEVREFLLSAAMLGFSLHGAISPNVLFRISKSKDKEN